MAKSERPGPADPIDFDGLVVDLDGVVWVGDEAIPGSAAALIALRDQGVDLVFLTNDPRGSRAQYVQRLHRIGFGAAKEQIVTSGSALAALIREREAPGTTAFVIGTSALKGELEQPALELLEGDAGRRADIVVVGGHEGFDFDELRIATSALRRGARLYGAGRDATFPMPDGPWPATGAILAAVEFAGGSRATVVGKPEVYIFDLARRLLNECNDVAVVGDNLDADIAGGKRAGLFTILVLTGTSSAAELPTAQAPPDLVVPDLASLARARARRSRPSQP
jgi:HAD superfamily hydrolase (TIGR01450 family)